MRWYECSLIDFSMLIVRCQDKNGFVDVTKCYVKVIRFILFFFLNSFVLSDFNLIILSRWKMDNECKFIGYSFLVLNAYLERFVLRRSFYALSLYLYVLLTFSDFLFILWKNVLNGEMLLFHSHILNSEDHKATYGPKQQQHQLEECSLSMLGMKNAENKKWSIVIQANISHIYADCLCTHTCIHVKRMLHMHNRNMQQPLGLLIRSTIFSRYSLQCWMFYSCCSYTISILYFINILPVTFFSFSAHFFLLLHIFAACLQCRTDFALTVFRLKFFFLVHFHYWYFILKNGSKKSHRYERVWVGSKIKKMFAVFYLNFSHFRIFIDSRIYNFHDFPVNLFRSHFFTGAEQFCLSDGMLALL